MHQYLILDQVRKSYADLPVLNGISACFEQGKTYCLLGPSGSGKTTLFRILLGLETMDRGNLLWTSKPTFSPFKRQGRFIDGNVPRFSAVFQENRLCEAFTPIENVMLTSGSSLRQKDVKKMLCELLPEESITRPVSTLSGGMKRRTAILRALLSPCDVLIMDEPFSGLDVDTKKTVIHYILEKSSEKLLLLSTHQHEDIELLGGIEIALHTLSTN